MRKHEFRWHESRDQSPLLSASPTLSRGTKRWYRLAFRLLSVTSLRKLNPSDSSRLLFCSASIFTKNIINTLNTRAWMKGGVKWSEALDYHDGDSEGYCCLGCDDVACLRKVDNYLPNYAASHSGRQHSLRCVQNQKQIFSVSAYLFVFYTLKA